MTLKEFLEKCTACGGNWTAMLLTGIQAVAPDVFNAMPDRSYDFEEVSFIVNHLCHDRPHQPIYISLAGNVIEHCNGSFLFRAATKAEIENFYNS